MDNKKKITLIEYTSFAAFSLLNVFIAIYRLQNGDMQFQDFHARWQECAYFIHGVNPFDALYQTSIIDKIGKIDPDMVTVPWAWIWGNIFNPGFLPYSIAKVWGVIIYVIVILTTGYTCTRYYFENKAFLHGISKQTHYCILFVLIILSQYSIIWSFLCGNQGALVCCILIDAVFTYEKHPYFAAFLMTIALIKPQISLPFFLVFLIIGQYKIIGLSAILELITICIIRSYIGVDIISLLLSTSETGTNLSGVFFGLFNLLKYTGLSTKIVLSMDMLAGIAFTIVTTLYIIKKMNLKPFSPNMAKAPLGCFYGAAISSTFWFYKQSHDFTICAIIHLILLFYYAKNRFTNNYKKAFFLQQTLLLVFYIQPILRRILVLYIPYISETLSKEIFMNLICFWLIFTTHFFLPRLLE